MFFLCAILEYCRVWGGKPLQPASPVDNSLFVDGSSWTVQSEFLKIFTLSLSSTRGQGLGNGSMTTGVGHRQNRRALFSFKPAVWTLLLNKWGGTQSGHVKRSGWVGGIGVLAAFLVVKSLFHSWIHFYQVKLGNTHIFHIYVYIYTYI